MYSELQNKRLLRRVNMLTGIGSSAKAVRMLWIARINAAARQNGLLLSINTRFAKQKL